MMAAIDWSEVMQAAEQYGRMVDAAFLVHRPPTSDPYELEADSLRDAADFCRCWLLKLNDCAIPLTAEDELAGRWWTRMRARLLERADKLLYTSTLPKTEQQALALLKTIAGELQQAGRALDAAALELNKRAGGMHAGKAKQAAQRALQTAEGLLS